MVRINHSLAGWLSIAICISKQSEKQGKTCEADGLVCVRKTMNRTAYNGRFATIRTSSSRALAPSRVYTACLQMHIMILRRQQCASSAIYVQEHTNREMSSKTLLSISTVKKISPWLQPLSLFSSSEELNLLRATLNCLALKLTIRLWSMNVYILWVKFESCSGVRSRK